MNFILIYIILIIFGENKYDKDAYYSECDENLYPPKSIIEKDWDLEEAQARTIIGKYS